MQRTVNCAFQYFESATQWSTGGGSLTVLHSPPAPSDLGWGSRLKALGVPDALRDPIGWCSGTTFLGGNRPSVNLANGSMLAALRSRVPPSAWPMGSNPRGAPGCATAAPEALMCTEELGAPAPLMLLPLLLACRPFAGGCCCCCWNTLTRACCCGGAEARLCCAGCCCCCCDFGGALAGGCGTMSGKAPFLLLPLPLLVPPLCADAPGTNALLTDPLYALGLDTVGPAVMGVAAAAGRCPG